SAANDLQRVDGRGDAGPVVDAVDFAAEGVLQIGVAATFAEARPGAGHGDGSGDDEVDVRQLPRIDGAANFGGSADRRRGTKITQAPRVQLPEAARLAQAGDGHVDDLALAQRAEPDVPLWSVRIALDGPRAAPLAGAGEAISGCGRADEVRNPSARAGARRGAAFLEQRPDPVADGLLPIVQGTSPSSPN